jgi:hypothetical protein
MTYEISIQTKLHAYMCSFFCQGISVDESTSETNTTQGAENNHDEKNIDTEDDDWWSDLGPDFSAYPRPRTAHAATVVGNELIIHGGMGGNEHTDEWDGSTAWESLGDMWIFNLNTREWTRRWLFPLLVRSYHSLVGWSASDDMMGWGGKLENDTSWEGPIVAVFGGYTAGMDDFSGAVSALRPHRACINQFSISAYILMSNAFSFSWFRMLHTYSMICWFHTHRH